MLAALTALVAAVAAGCGAAPTTSGNASSSAHALAPSTYFNPVPTCSALEPTELHGLLGGTVPTSVRPATGNQGEFESCTWNAAADRSNVLLTLDFGVSAIECSQLEPASGVAALPGVGEFAYYENGHLTAWSNGLEVQLQVASPVSPAELPALMSTDVKAVFVRMGAI